MSEQLCLIGRLRLRVLGGLVKGPWSNAGASEAARRVYAAKALDKLVPWGLWRVRAGATGCAASALPSHVAANAGGWGQSPRTDGTRGHAPAA